ncbi:unnamed protein product [Boreogadus saida]
MSRYVLTVISESHVEPDSPLARCGQPCCPSEHSFWTSAVRAAPERVSVSGAQWGVTGRTDGMEVLLTIPAVAVEEGYCQRDYSISASHGAIKQGQGPSRLRGPLTDGSALRLSPPSPRLLEDGLHLQQSPIDFLLRLREGLHIDSGLRS